MGQKNIKNTFSALAIALLFVVSIASSAFAIGVPSVGSTPTVTVPAPTENPEEDYVPVDEKIISNTTQLSNSSEEMINSTLVKTKINSENFTKNINQYQRKFMEECEKEHNQSDCEKALKRIRKISDKIPKNLLKQNEFEKKFKLNRRDFIKFNTFKNQAYKLENLSKEDVEKIAKLNRADLNKLLEKNPQEIMERAKNLKVKKVKIDDFLKERKIPKQNLEKIRKQYNEAAKQYEKAKERFLKSRNEYKKAIEDYKNCNEDGNSTKCAELEKEANEKVKSHLQNTIETIGNTIEKLKLRLEENENLNQSFVQERVQELEQVNSQLQSISVKLNQSESKEEIKNLGKELSQVWQRARVQINNDNTRLYASRINEVVKRAEVLEYRMNSVVANLSEEDTSSINEKLEKFSNYINIAKEQYHKYNQEMGNAEKTTDLKQKQEKITEAHKYLVESRKSLNEAYKEFKDIMKQLREKGQQIGIVNGSEIEIVE